MTALISTFIVNMVHSGTPIIFALIGDMIGQKSGHISLSVEGSMLMGCCLGYTACFYSNNLFLAVLVAIAGGALIGFLQAHLNIHFGANMFALALALNYFASSVTAYFGSPMISKSIKGFPTIAIPVLSKIPLIGQAFFHQDILTYLSFVLPVIAWFVLYKTRLGLAIRSCGEVHQVAIAYGYNVKRIKYGAVMMAGVLAAIGGCQLACAYTKTWTADMSSGRGFIASALVILCCWKPLRAYFAAYLFGAAQALGVLFQLLDVPIPTNIVNMMPYVITLIALAFTTLNKSPVMPEELKKLGRPLELLD